MFDLLTTIYRLKIDLWDSVLLTLFVTIITLQVWQYVSSRKKLPPGPWGIPFVGYVPFMSNHPHEDFAKLAKKYGNVFSLYLGNRLVVVLGSYESIREAFVKQADNFSARPRIAIYKSPQNQYQGVTTNEGESWLQYRRFALTTLRDFGIGTMNIEPRIKEEVNFFLAALQEFKGNPTDIDELIRMSVSNVMCSLIFGKRYEYHDPELKLLLEGIKEFIKRSKLAGNIEFLPWLAKIPGIAGNKLLGETVEQVNHEMKKKINQHVTDYKTGSQTDFIDAWITEGEKHLNDDHHFKTENLAGVIRNLFIAGSDTTATTLRWSLLYLMKHPDIQRRVHAEIDDVIGQERTPSLLDRNSMNYTEAVLAEVQRISSIVPLSITHSNFKETTLFGYTIPKRSVIMPNLWAVHHNPQFYPDPDKFLPDRFLDETGKLKKLEQLIPFSMGKRACPAEALAKSELFLYFTSMLQCFEFRKPHDTELCFDYEYALVSFPKTYKVHAVPRNTC